MTRYPQYTLSSAFAESGDKTIPPSTSEEAGLGRLSQAEGWGAYNAKPIAEGGIPPKREDFNGLAFMLSQLLVWYQQGGIMRYSAEFDYEVGNEVFYRDSKFRCLKENGKSSEIVVPGSDKKVWRNMDTPSVLAGQVTAFYNCRLGGSDGRRLIPWGETDADERYVICDGGDDGMGGKVPDLIDKFLLPCTIATVGQIGGSLTASTDAKQISGTVGETVLTLEQIPSHAHSGKTASAGGHTHTVTVQSGGSHGHSGEASSAGSHTHSGSTSSAGSHSHTRGSMNITGTAWAYEVGKAGGWKTTGAFYDAGAGGAKGSHDNSDTCANLGFDASRSWTGYTSSDGYHSHSMSLNSAGSHTHSVTISSGGSHSHTATVTTNGSHEHTVTISSVGGGLGHTHSLTGASHTHSVALERPPFYRMAFFVKLPE